MTITRHGASDPRSVVRPAGVSPVSGSAGRLSHRCSMIATIFIGLISGIAVGIFSTVLLACCLTLCTVTRGEHPAFGRPVRDPRPEPANDTEATETDPLPPAA